MNRTLYVIKAGILLAVMLSVSACASATPDWINQSGAELAYSHKGSGE